MCPEETYAHTNSGKEGSDTEELREIFTAIADFIKQIKTELKELLMVSYEALSGEKLGEEVSKFYNSLIEKGVPKELAEKMTMEYFHRRLEAVPDIGKILSSFKMLSGKKGVGLPREGGIKLEMKLPSKDKEEGEEKKE